MNTITSTSPIIADYRNATGKIDYTFTNDYMFRMILQKHSNVLKGLICSLLHLRPEDIRSVVITNPIEPGAAIDSKEFILDIAVNLNNGTFLNLEMQINPLPGWNDRFLSYLCRSFDQLTRGNDYDTIKPVIHICFLDFQPFEDNLEFVIVQNQAEIYKIMCECLHSST